MTRTDQKRGHYLGTEIDGKWWRRYRENGFFARGVGDWWLFEDALYFHRYLTKAPIRIPLDAVTGIQLGKWHAGRWAAGAPVVKILWQAGHSRLSAGLILSRDSQETDALVESLRAAVSSSGGGSTD